MLGTARIWDLTAGHLINEFKTHSRAAIAQALFHPTELLFASAGKDG